MSELNHAPVPDPNAREQDLAGIDAMLQEYAAKYREMAHKTWDRSFGLGRRDWSKPDPLSLKFHCAALCPHQITRDMFEKMPGFHRLMEAAKAEDLNSAFSIAVCHFKPGPNAEGLWPISNREAIVSVHVDGEKSFEDSSLTVYEDKFEHTQDYTVGLKDLDRYHVLRPLRFRTRAGFVFSRL